MKFISKYIYIVVALFSCELALAVSVNPKLTFGAPTVASYMAAFVAVTECGFGRVNFNVRRP